MPTRQHQRLIRRAPPRSSSENDVTVPVEEETTTSRRRSSLPDNTSDTHLINLCQKDGQRAHEQQHQRQALLNQTQRLQQQAGAW